MALGLEEVLCLFFGSMAALVHVLQLRSIDGGIAGSFKPHNERSMLSLTDQAYLDVEPLNRSTP